MAQFYLHGEVPDGTVCGSWFTCSDNVALDAFMGRKQEPVNAADKKRTSSGKNGARRNALTMLVRDFVWNSRRWEKNGFWEWVEDFEPELILLQAGDCRFMFRLAERLSKKCCVPLVIYNSEGYYFKDFDYFRAKGLAHFCYPFFIDQFRRQFRKTMSCASHVIYPCEELQSAYNAEFSVPSDVLYTISELIPYRVKPAENYFSASYLGNLGVGRHEPLMEIGRTLRSISAHATLHVYGRVPSETIRKQFEECPGVEYHGVVPYGMVKKIMEGSDLLIHAENFSAFYQEDLKFAFSTKIADSLASGRCFFLYAPQEMACTNYLNKYQAAYTASDLESMQKILRELVEQPLARERYLARAAELTKENHRQGRNALKFRSILMKAAEKHEDSAS